MKQPGDGSCLFHSLAHGLQATITATALRLVLLNEMDLKILRLSASLPHANEAEGVF